MSQIAKIPLCLLVAFSSLFGFVYGAQTISWLALLVFLAVFLLASGAATLNSYQERVNDGLMRRTRLRPLVTGKISNRVAIFQALILLSLGLTLLLLYTNRAALVVGIAAFCLYNFIYTRLKNTSFLAIIPGAICGALPPYIGWLAAGGDLFAYRSMLPVLLLLFWQIPHFFLVLLNHKSDYLLSRNPNMLSRLSESSLQRLFLPWVAALVVTMLSFTVVPLGMFFLWRVVIVVNAVLLYGIFAHSIMGAKKIPYRFLFVHLNLSIFIHMLVVCMDEIDVM